MPLNSFENLKTSFKSRLTPLSLHLASRIGISFLVCLILVALFFGRRLERTYPELIMLIPYATALAALIYAGAAFLIGIRTRPTRAAIFRSCAVLLPFFAIVPYLMSNLILLRIEYIHLLKYGSLALFLYCVLRSRLGGFALASATVAAAVAGISEELAQQFIPARIFDTRDLILNVASACAGGLYTACLAYIAEPDSDSPAVSANGRPGSRQRR